MQLISKDVAGVNPVSLPEELEALEKPSDYVDLAVARSAEEPGFYVVLGENLASHSPSARVFKVFAASGTLIAQNLV